MKQKSDPRHLKRAKLFKELFSVSFRTQLKEKKELNIILKNKSKIDLAIKEAAPDWPIEQINRVDLSLLRLAIYELFYSKVPKKVIVDEAVELAKEFGSDSSPKFVNGVLGTIIQKMKTSKKEE